MEEIAKAKASPSFSREYDLKYLGIVGNVFHTKDIETAIQKGEQYKPEDINYYAQKCIGLDPGFGSSPFGVVTVIRATQLVNDLVNLISFQQIQKHIQLSIYS